MMERSKSSAYGNLNEAVACLHPRRTSIVTGHERNRFSHLLLEHGERQLHDWAVIASSSSPLTLSSYSSTKSKKSPNRTKINSEILERTARNGSTGNINNVANNNGLSSPSSSFDSERQRQQFMDTALPSTCMGRIEGRLRLCSISLVFEPDDWSRGIMRCPFKYMEGPPSVLSSAEDGISAVASPTISATNCNGDSSTVVIKCTRHLVMKTGNVIAPFENLEILTVFRFTFVHSSPKRFLELSTVRIVSGVFLIDFLHDTTRVSTHRKRLHCRFHTQNPHVSQLLFNGKNGGQSAIDQITKAATDGTFDASNFVDVREKTLTTNLRCSILTPLLSNPGCAIVTDSHIYFQPPSGIPGSGVTAKASSWALKSITGYARRYNGLKDSGLELFLKDKTSVLLAFETPSDRERVMRLLPTNVPCHTDREFVIAAVAQWQKGTMSNFDYLLALNSAAGRTFHDLSRYPVFPWVISDYKCSKLDLNSPNTFRDLSKPVGALDEKRLEYFQARFEGMHDMEHPFLYGTHYSAPGYVLYYLVRSMPEHMLCLQNGELLYFALCADQGIY